MKSLLSLCIACICFSASGIAATPVPNNKKIAKLYISHFENVLGTSMELKVAAFSQKNASQAEAVALAEIKRIAKILSTYDADSEFSHWFATQNTPVTVSPELFEVLSLYDDWRTKTHGALDASAQVVSKLWKQSAAKKELPTQEALKAAVAEVQQSHWTLNAAAQTATHLTKAPLILNSFTKSYIIKHAADAAMAAAGVRSVVVNIGGDIVIAGDVNETVRISDPKADAENDAPIDAVLVHDRAIATSGNYRRGELINGQWYSHIVDPRTGQPAGDIISATVIAPNATDAGALATSFNILTPAESMELAAKMPDIEYLLITKTGERIESKGWAALEIPGEKNTTDKLKEGWNNGFELAVNLELSTIVSDRVAHRPFVAIWIEDKDKAPVRNVSLWYNKPKWLNDLKEWYRINGQNFMVDKTPYTSVTSATRSPGKYTIKWDGKDEKGEFVKPGNYTVCIEVAREHGTYQIIRQELECKKKPNSINLAGNVEIAAASLEYRKRTTDN